MVRWVHFLQTPSLFPTGVAELLQRKTILNNGDTLQFYGFGNGFEMQDGYTFIQHLGSVSAYRTVLARYPKQQLAIIFLTNNHNDAAFVRATTLSDLFLGRKETKVFDPIDFPDLQASLDATIPYGPVDTETDIEPYAGTYLQDQVGSTFTINANGNKLTAINTRKDSVYLRYLKKDVFPSNSPAMPHSFQFTRDLSGRVSSFIHNGGEKEIVFRKID
jgi:hypothetical protein